MIFVNRDEALHLKLKTAVITITAVVGGYFLYISVVHPFQETGQRPGMVGNPSCIQPKRGKKCPNLFFVCPLSHVLLTYFYKYMYNSSSA